MHRILLSFAALSLLGAGPPAVTAVAWQILGRTTWFARPRELMLALNQAWSAVRIP